MKRKLYPFGLLYLITITLYLLVILISVYVCLMFWTKLIQSKDLILVIPIMSALFAIIIFSLSCIDIFSNKIIFNDEGILVTGQKFKGGIQRNEYIYYSEIKDIKIICAHIDSKGKPIKNNGIVSVRPHIFFEFVMNNESIKLIHIDIYSINQRKKILDIINKKAQLDFS